MSITRTITDDVWIAVHQGRNYICTTANDEFTHAQLAYRFLVEVCNRMHPDQTPIVADEFGLLQYRKPGVAYGRAELVGQIRSLLAVDSQVIELTNGNEYALIINGISYYILREGPDYSL